MGIANIEIFYLLNPRECYGWWLQGMITIYFPLEIAPM